MNRKQNLRRKIGIERKNLPQDQVAAMSRSIIKHIQSMEAFRGAQTIALYKSIQNEVELEPLFSLCWASGKRTAIPVFNAARGTYDLAEISADTVFIRGNYGIPEPADIHLIPVDRMDLILVPGIAFDRAGNRLGRGGGYYDRLLEKFTGSTAGIAFDFQLVDDIPAASHDISVDVVITESGIIEV